MMEPEPTNNEKVKNMLLKGLEKTYTEGGMSYSIAYSVIRKHINVGDDDCWIIGRALVELLEIKSGHIWNPMGMTNLPKAQGIAGQVLKNIGKYKLTIGRYT